jgi:hypothetical protein
VRARPCPLTGGPHLSAPTRTRTPSLPLSPSAQWGQPVGAKFPSLVRPFPLAVQWVRSVSADRSFVSSLSVAHGPHTSAPYASLTSRPHTPSWTRPRRASLGHLPTCPTPFLSPHHTHSLPLPSSAPLHTSRTSPSHNSRPRSTITVRRDLRSVPRPPSSLCRVRCSSELRLLASNSRQPLVCPYPLYSPLLTLIGLLAMQPCCHRYRPGAPLCSRRRSSTLEPSLEVTHLSMPLISLSLPCCSRNSSLE